MRRDGETMRVEERRDGETVKGGRREERERQWEERRGRDSEKRID